MPLFDRVANYKTVLRADSARKTVVVCVLSNPV